MPFRFTGRLPGFFAPSLLFLAAVGHPVDTRAMDRLRYQSYPDLDGRIIEKVLILGNNRTQDIVFLREMRTQPGERFQSEDLWHDWERLFDLGIFANVEVEAVPSGDAVLVVVSAHERPWWFIAPLLEYSLERKQLTYGYTARIRNYRGMNQQLRSRGTAGARDRFSISWTTPWLGKTRQSLSFDVSIDLKGDKDENNIRAKRFTVGSTRFIGNYLVLRQGISGFVQIENLNADGPDVPPELAVDETLPAVGGAYSRDSRNIQIDPRRGSFLAISPQYVVGVTTSQARYFRLGLNGRKFQMIGPRLLIAVGGSAVLSDGDVPFYRRLSVGGPSSIRGHPEDLIVGSSIATGHVELRFPIMGQRRFGIPIPFVPSEISNFDLRIDGDLFVDAGTSWGEGQLPRARVAKGAGFGLRIFLPILEIARLEVAFDEDGNATFYFAEGNLI